MFWKRRPSPKSSALTAELAQLLVESHVETIAKQQRAIERWGLGASDSWSADLEAGTIVFEFADHRARGQCHFLGSYAIEAGTWLWGWANESVPAAARQAASEVRALAERPGLELLTIPEVELRAEFADDFASIMVETAQLDGWYRSPSRWHYAYLGFTGLEVEPRIR